MLTARQRRMMVLPAPHGGLDKNDRYEIGIFYSFAVFVRTITLPLRVLFHSVEQQFVFFSNDVEGGAVSFSSVASISPRRALFDVNKEPTVFQSPYTSNIFVSLRKTK